ncbi:hypothetical protein GCM10027047_06950 [Rhodococcus aerolatus]
MTPAPDRRDPDRPDPSAPLRAAVRSGAVGAVGLAVVAGVLGLLVRGTPGLWGGLLGAAVAAAFVVFTAVAVLLTRDLAPTVSGAVLLGSWIVKLLLLVVVLALLRGLTFYDRTTLGLTVVLAAVGLLSLETLAVLRTRVPYVDPEPSA